MVKQLTIIILSLFILLPDAWAFPVDETQEPLPHLGLDDPGFFECHVEYWQCRRELARQVRDYAECVGGVRTLNRLVGLAPPVVNQSFLDTWDSIPPYAVVDKPRDQRSCQAQIEACMATRQPAHLDACRAYRRFVMCLYFGAC